MELRERVDAKEEKNQTEVEYIFKREIDSVSGV